MAATLVHDAMEGRSAEIKTEPKYVRLVYLYQAFFIVMNILHGVQHKIYVDSGSVFNSSATLIVELYLKKYVCLVFTTLLCLYDKFTK